jgi:hypothetical protein
MRQAVTARAGDRCEYCLSLAEYAPDTFAVEHIIPRSRGGNDRLTNLALSCQGCNNHKYTRTTAVDPETGEAASLYHPRQHRWREHFTWNEDFTLILGLTPTGRATIAQLHLNRPHVVNLRRLLNAVGEHPPSDTLQEESCPFSRGSLRAVSATSVCSAV